MKSRTWIAMIIGCAVVSMFGASRCAAQQEVGSYVYFQPGTGQATRHPRVTGGGGFVALPTPCPQPYSVPAFSTVLIAAQQTCKVGATIYSLAYVSITGSLAGGITIFPDSNGNFADQVGVTLGSSNIVVSYIYFQGGGGSCPPNQLCPSGAGIDEFSETTNQLDDDLFVTAYSPIGSTTEDVGLTNTGNIYGSVATTTASVEIVAYASTTTGGLFDRWATAPGGTIVSAQNLEPGAENYQVAGLEVGMGVNDYALALYRSACPTGYYWNPSATISQCSKAPVCSANEAWNSESNECVPIDKCPTNCKYGCYFPQITPEGPVWRCKPPNGGCTAAQDTAGCGKNQYCAEPGGIVGDNPRDCHCLECATLQH